MRDKAYPPTTQTDNVGAVVAANIGRMMRKWEMVGDAELARLAGIDQKTVWRVRHEKMSPTIRTVAMISAVFGLYAWQLMCPGLDPDNPPHPMRRASDRN